MRLNPRLAVSGGIASGCIAALGLAGLVAAPTAAAGCNDSSGTVVCAQGEIRGTSGPPPSAPIQGAWGSWCNSTICYPGYTGGFGVWIGP